MTLGFDTTGLYALIDLRRQTGAMIVKEAQRVLDSWARQIAESCARDESPCVELGIAA
ncbi:MAG: hypothetical protein ABIR91_00135 [Candidatus Saccharimonadales bacterium]